MPLSSQRSSTDLTMEAVTWVQIRRRARISLFSPPLLVLLAGGVAVQALFNFKWKWQQKTESQDTQDSLVFSNCQRESCLVTLGESYHQPTSQDSEYWPEQPTVSLTTISSSKASKNIQWINKMESFMLKHQEAASVWNLVNYTFKSPF